MQLREHQVAVEMLNSENHGALGRRRCCKTDSQPMIPSPKNPRLRLLNMRADSGNRNVHSGLRAVQPALECAVPPTVLPTGT